MMDAFIHKKIEHDVVVNEQLMDIQQLNETAIKGLYDVSKISAACLPLVSEKYQLLDAGSAMGFGVGPILVSKEKIDLNSLDSFTVAIPGKNTTANKLFHHFYKAKTVKYLVFSDIETAILNGEADAGVLIHEGRFTFEKKGLRLMQDLGALWEKTYHLPIPLGVLVAKKSLGKEKINQLEKLVRQSIQYAFINPSSSADYVKNNAQEMTLKIVDQHIKLYVNEYSISMGEDGRKAIAFLLAKLSSS